MVYSSHFFIFSKPTAVGSLYMYGVRIQIQLNPEFPSVSEVTSQAKTCRHFFHLLFDVPAFHLPKLSANSSKPLGG